MDHFHSGMIYCRYCGEQIEPYRDRCPYCASILRNKYSYRYPSGNVSFDLMQAEMTPYSQLVTPEQDVLSDLSDPLAEQNEDRQTSIQEEQPDIPVFPNDGPTAYFRSENVKKSLSNRLKVFLTTIFSVIPLLGQAAGIIAAIVFMTSQTDDDRRSFGNALFAASLIMFVIWGVISFFLFMWSWFYY